MKTLCTYDGISIALKNDEISESCAQYFRDLLYTAKLALRANKTYTIKTKAEKTKAKNEHQLYEGDLSHQILYKIGEISQYNEQSDTCHFDVLTYIRKTQYNNCKNGVKKAYLANVIGFEFIELDKYIAKELNKQELSHSQLLEIKTYLENTFDVCAKKDDSRRGYVSNLISYINYKIRKIELVSELGNLETNPPKDVDADVIIHKIATLRKKITAKDKEIEDALNHTIDL